MLKRIIQNRFYSLESSSGNELGPLEGEILEAAINLRANEIAELAIKSGEISISPIASRYINSNIALRLLYSTNFGKEALGALVGSIYAKGFMDGFEAKSKEE
jgi:hypothetical protein